MKAYTLLENTLHDIEEGIKENITAYTFSKYMNDENAKYSLLKDKIYFERVDTRQYDGNYCQMEWFTPVTVK